MEDLKKKLQKIGWDIKGKYPNRFIFDHNTKRTPYRVKQDSVEISNVHEHSSVYFNFSEAKAVMTGDDNTTVSFGTEHCFIQFYNFDNHTKQLTNNKQP